MKDPFLHNPAAPITAKRAAAVTLLCLTVFFLSSCSELQTLRLIKADQTRRIEELETELEKVSAQNIDALRKQNDTVKFLNTNLETTKAELYKAQTQRTKNERELEKTAREAVLKLDEQTRELERYKELGRIRTEEIQAKNTENQDLKKNLDALNEQVKSMEADLEKSRVDFNDLLKTANAKEDEQDTIVQDLKTRIESGSVASANLMKTVDSQKTALVERDGKIESLTGELATEKKRTRKLEDNVKNFEAQIRKFNETLQKASANNGDETLAVKQEKLALEKEMLQLRKQIETLRKGGTVTDADFQEALNLLKVSLQPLDDANFASVETDSRGVVVRLSADFLFKPGTVILDPQVLATLDQIADILAKYDKKYIEIQGHTDAQHTERMPFVDNWALASARADKIVRHFANHGKISPERLKSASCAQYRPPAGEPAKVRKMLRRVDIILTAHP